MSDHKYVVISKQNTCSEGIYLEYNVKTLRCVLSAKEPNCSYSSHYTTEKKKSMEKRKETNRVFLAELKCALALVSLPYN